LFSNLVILAASGRPLFVLDGGQHADDGKPDVGRTLRRIATEADTQHVRERLEQCPRILLQPAGVLPGTHADTQVSKKVSLLILQHKTTLDFIELGIDIKHKIIIYISSTHKKQTTMQSEKQAKPLILFNEFYDKDKY